MKASEVPEKLYLHPTAKGKVGASWLTFPLTNEDIEYIRKDAFIEKAEEFIYSALNDGIMGTANIEDFMRLFKNYMEGE
jgi:hypothetical protein